MKRTAYSIRKGFEYQDLVTALVLLEQLESGHFDWKFQIESDAAEFVDDLTIHGSEGTRVGSQVKFHTTLAHIDSFATLTKKATAGSRSLLQKLYAGWSQLSSRGDFDCAIQFYSNAQVERKAGDLGSAIEGASRRIGERFFRDGEFSRIRDTICGHLGATTEELRSFFAAVKWNFNNPALDDLKASAARKLREMKLPHHMEAVAVLVSAIGTFATDVHEDRPIGALVESLWEIHVFREACEQRFPEQLTGIMKRERASVVTVAAVSLWTLPAFASPRAACLEEPLPLGDYTKGITSLPLTLDGLRASLYAEYLDWHKRRVLALLDHLSTTSLDVLVFPRFALPLEIAAEVAQWAETKGCTVVIGGHTIPATAEQRAIYEQQLNLVLPDALGAAADETVPVIDIAYRPDRNSRYSLSRLRSPTT